MNGFLHRVVTSVVRPQPSLHPLVESIYSTPMRHRPREPRLQFEAIVPGSPMEHFEGQAVQPDSFSEQVQSPVSSLTLQVKAQHEKITREGGVFRPMLSRQEANPTSDAMRLNPSAERTEDSTSSASFGEGLRKASDYVPIVADHRSRDERMDVINPSEMHAQSEDLSTVARVNDRRQSPQISHIPRNAQPQSDDIQIHIGRIEVVAVPQAPPRPPIAPTRKGISLDEYLSRGGSG
jgi:hypothetical protein